jgi:hypothetical protein
MNSHLLPLSFYPEVQLEIYLGPLILKIRGGVAYRRIFLCRGNPALKKSRTPNSCGIGQQPLDRKVDQLLFLGFEQFNEQTLI